MRAPKYWGRQFRSARPIVRPGLCISSPVQGTRTTDVKRITHTHTCVGRSARTSLEVRNKALRSVSVVAGHRLLDIVTGPRLRWHIRTDLSKFILTPHHTKSSTPPTHQVSSNPL